MPGAKARIGWRGRLAMAFVLASMLSVLVVVNGVARVAEAGNPALAHYINPYDARASAGLADFLLQSDQSVGVRNEVRPLALMALLRDPTSVTAARVLGMVADLDGDQKRATAFMGYAERNSRRDIATELWLIEAAVNNDNVAGALSHFDHALRTSQLAPGILIPVLVNATDDPALVAPIQHLLASNPTWGVSFLSSAISKGPSLDNAVALFMATPRYGDPIGSEMVRQALNRITVDRRFDLGWKIYAREVGANPKTGATQVHDGTFDVAPRFVPFDWSLSANAARGARPDGGKGQALLISPGPGEAARQVVQLAPGGYRLLGVYGVTAASSHLQAQVVCASHSQALLGRTELGPIGGTSAPFSLAFTVPSDCPAQWLTFSGIGGNGDQPIAWVDSVRADPAR